MKWLLKNEYQYNNKIFAIMAKNMNLNNMMWLYEKKCQYDK
jgi:hypothetical protein